MRPDYSHKIFDDKRLRPFISRTHHSNLNK